MTKLNKIKYFLQSDYLMYIIFGISFILWALDLGLACVFFLATFVAIMLFLCDDLKNIFPPIIYVSFFLGSLPSSNWICYFICIGLVVSAIVFFVIKAFVLHKDKLIKGKLFFPLLVADIGFCLAGILTNFNFLAFLITFGFCIISYGIYWIAINFCPDFKEYLLKLITVGAVFLALEVWFQIVFSGFFVDALYYPLFYTVGAQNINVVSLFMCIGMVGCFSIGFKKKYDYLYFILALFLAFTCYILYCRMMILLAFLVLVTLTIYTFCKSKNKRVFCAIFGVFLLAIALFAIISFERFSDFIVSLIDKIKIGGNGRESLWPWCWDRFLENPIFGYGFVSKTAIPSLEGNIINLILAHNTVLQFFVSLGVVGTCLMMYFYFTKYKLVFKNYSASKFFLVVAILVIAISGITDQAAIMDIFTYLLSILLLVAIETMPTEPKN